MTEHQRVHNLLTLAAAGVLTPSEERRVRQHLRHCEECQAELNGWNRLAGTLKGLPTPQAPPRLVLHTQRLVRHAAVVRQQAGSKLWLAILITFSWIVAFLNVRFLQMLDLPVAQWLDVSSTTLWMTYIGWTWLATALAAGLLGRKRWQQEGRSL